MADRISAIDGVQLAVYEAGAPSAPTILAVHGYPDNHTVWDGLVDQLAGRYRVISYDVRGAGASDKPTARGAYRMPQLVADLASVADAVSPDTPVHLVGHDWGSIQAWAAVVDPRLAGRIATFTSISGPSLEYASAWLRGARQHPAAALRQLAHSYYLALFQLPVLPEMAVRRGVLDWAIRRASRGHAATRPEADKVYGLELYRANLPGRIARPRPVSDDLPVQVVVPAADAFVTPALAAEAPLPWVPDLTVHRIPGGHWVVAERPELVARLVDEFVTAH